MTYSFTIDQLEDFLEEFMGISSFDSERHDELVSLLSQLADQGKLEISE